MEGLIAKAKQTASSTKPARATRKGAARKAAARNSAPAAKKGAQTKPAKQGRTKSAPQVEQGSTKQARVIILLQRDSGATLDELVAATRRLPHTTRAALTGLRHKGFVLDKSKRQDGTTAYRITSAPKADKAGSLR